LVWGGRGGRNLSTKVLKSRLSPAVVTEKDSGRFDTGVFKNEGMEDEPRKEVGL
jgi:hypothetical protein